MKIKIKAIYTRILDFGVIGASICMLFVLVAVLLEIFLRYFLNKPQVWVLQFSEYALLFIPFLGAAWVLKRGRHVSLDIVLTRLKPRAKALLNITTSLACAVLCLVLVWYGVKVTWVYFQMGYYFEPIEVPRAPIMAIIPVGSFLLFIQFLVRAYGHLERWRTSRDKEEQRVVEKFINLNGEAGIERV